MGYKYFMNNPIGARVGDCAVRAISKTLNISWDEAFDVLVNTARMRADMPSSNAVIDEVLSDYGFHKETFSDCYKCHTVSEFAQNHPYGTYVLGTGSHVVAVLDGDFYDSWRSDDEPILFFWSK